MSLAMLGVHPDKLHLTATQSQTSEILSGREGTRRYKTSMELGLKASVWSVICGNQAFAKPGWVSAQFLHC